MKRRKSPRKRGRKRREPVHYRANYARDSRSRFRCPGCVTNKWYGDKGILPDPVRWGPIACVGETHAGGVNPDGTIYTDTIIR
jgi:hypothetical protein